MQAINRHTETEMQYNGVVDAVRRMLADEGIAGFYKGERQCRPALERFRAIKHNLLPPSIRSVP